MIALARRPLAGDFSRRGACPALSAPMQTGDGLLVRLNPVAGGLSPQALIGLCDAAAAYGNGVVEVTARGSVQIRGLTLASAGLFAKAVDRLGIAVCTGVPVQTGVLAGLDPDEIADPTRLVDMVRTGIAKAGLEARLGPKVSVVVDGGGRTALDEVAADVRLTAIGGGAAPAWQVAIACTAGTARPLGMAGGDEAACKAALALLSGIAAMGREARARDLSAETSSARPSSSGLPRESADVGGSGSVEESSLIGITSLRSGRVALGTALPFGHTTANALKTFAEAARALGVGDIRPAPKRTLVAICGKVAQAETLRKQAETLGLVTAPDDPRQAISACPGAPDCASGHIPARQIAAEIAWEYRSLLDGSIHLHVSGCAKGCAHPGVSALTVVGSETGTGLVFGGTARDEPVALTDNDGAGRALANVAKRVSAGHRKGETTAQTIQILGLSALAEAFRQGGK